MARAFALAVVAILHLDLSCAMKLHDEASRGSSNRTVANSDCRAGSEKFVNVLANELENSLGYNGMFYKGCLNFVKKNANTSMPIMAQIEAWACNVQMNSAFFLPSAHGHSDL